MLSAVEYFLKSDDSVRTLIRECVFNEEYCKIALEELKSVIKGEQVRNEELHKMLKEKNFELGKLNEENTRLQHQVFELQAKTMGLTLYEAEMMKTSYEKGVSLRKLAEDFNCDKSTIKRRLIKMGVTIRE